MSGPAVPQERVEGIWLPQLPPEAVPVWRLLRALLERGESLPALRAAVHRLEQEEQARRVARVLRCGPGPVKARRVGGGRAGG